tara:strand:- start:957 stop:1760 length:804 start_codon:yes stop_codon:yes gene_type:complete
LSVALNLINQTKLPNPEDTISEVKKKGFLICNDAIEESISRELEDYWINQFINIQSEKIHKYYRSFLFRLGEENFFATSNKETDFRLKRQEFLWNEMHETTRSMVTEMHKYQNLCLNRDVNEGLIYSEKKSALTLSVNYYPPSKGILSEHKDVFDSDLLLWMIFNLTYKGEHYEEGGTYLINKEGEKINLDDLSKRGSIIFFNGALNHGVERIISSKDIGKISFFPFNAFFLNQDIIPNSIKNLIKVYERFDKFINRSKDRRFGLKG